MEKKLIFYPNCSRGGVTSVLRARARREPNTEFHLIFNNDKGGRAAFNDLENVEISIVRKDRMPSLLKWLVAENAYSEISILSSPEAVAALIDIEDLAVVYEFHSSNEDIVKSEISKIDVDKLALVRTPSEENAVMVRRNLPKRVQYRLQVHPNQLDTVAFSPDGSADFFEYATSVSGEVPVVWVGRVDKQKGFHYFLRTLAALPDNFIGYMVLSMEENPDRALRLLNEARASGVFDRLRLLSNLPQRVVGNLMRSARDAGGALVSTSLNESFGYSVYESLHAGLPVAAFHLPVWNELRSNEQFTSVPVGDVFGLAREIAAVSRNSVD